MLELTDNRGTGTFKFNNGDVYDGSWKKGRKDGKGESMGEQYSGVNIRFATIQAGAKKQASIVTEEPTMQADWALHITSFDRAS